MGESFEYPVGRRSFFLASAAFLFSTACASDARNADNAASADTKRRNPGTVRLVEFSDSGKWEL